MITFLQHQSQLVLRCRYGFTNHRRFFLPATSSCHYTDCKKQLPDNCYTSNYSYYYSSYKHIRTANNILSSTNSINQYCNANNNQLRWFSSTIGYHGTPYGGRDRGRGRGNDRGRGHQSTNRIPRMKDCRTLEDAINSMYDNLDKVSPRDISAFWAVVPRLLRYQERGVNLVPQLEAIFHKTADQIHSYGPKDLTTATLGFAKIIQSLQNSKRGYSSGSYEDYLHGILIRQRNEVFDFFARTAVNKLNQFEPRDLKDLAYTYALLEYVPKQLDDGSTLFNHIAEKSIPLLNKFKTQQLANTIWAFEKVKVSHTKLFKKVGDYIVSLDHLNDFQPQNLSNIVWSYTKAGVSHQGLYERVGDHIIARHHLNDFIPQELSNIVYSYAKAGISHPELFNKVADHIVTLNHLNEFKPQELANSVWAYAKAKVSHHVLFNKVADHVVTFPNLDDYTEQNISNLVWAYHKAGVSHPNLFNKVADHIVSLDNLDDYTAQAICNLAWAYHKAGIIRQDLNDKFIRAAVSRKEEFSSRALNNLYHWTSEEEGMQNQEDDEQSEDENDSVAAVDDDNVNSKDGEIEDDDPDASTPEDLSLLTVVQLKDRLRDIGLPVSGRKQELIDRLNDHFQK